MVIDVLKVQKSAKIIVHELLLWAIMFCSYLTQLQYAACILLMYGKKIKRIMFAINWHDVRV